MHRDAILASAKQTPSAFSSGSWVTGDASAAVRAFSAEWHESWNVAAHVSPPTHVCDGSALTLRSPPDGQALPATARGRPLRRVVGLSGDVERLRAAAKRRSSIAAPRICRVTLARASLVSGFVICGHLACRFRWHRRRGPSSRGPAKAGLLSRQRCRGWHAASPAAHGSL